MCLSVRGRAGGINYFFTRMCERASGKVLRTKWDFWWENLRVQKVCQYEAGAEVEVEGKAIVRIEWPLVKKRLF